MQVEHYLFGGFVILSILALILIVGGFFADAQKSRTDEAAANPLPRPNHLASAVFNLGMGAIWAYLMTSGGRMEPGWLMICAVAIFLVFGLIDLFRHLNLAFRAK